MECGAAPGQSGSHNDDRVRRTLVHVSLARGGAVRGYLTSVIFILNWWLCSDSGAIYMEIRQLPKRMNASHTAVVGGGIIGMAIAWRLARRGERVTVYEKGRVGGEASRLAAGMLAASAEVGYEEFELYELCRRSLALWPEFASQLEAESGVDIDYRSDGTLIVARDADAARALKRAHTFQKEQGFDVRWLSRDEALEIEPFLSPRIAAAVFAPEDHAVDNRQVLEALRLAFLGAAGELREDCGAVFVDQNPDGLRVRLETGEDVPVERVVLAAGAWTMNVSGNNLIPLPPVRPVKGQILELLMEAPFDLQHVVRGARAYLVPRTDGRLIVGATSEEMGFDKRVTAGGVLNILDGAWELVPGIHDLPLLGVEAGLRPASKDHQPVIGWTSTPGVYVATGHYRHGILLSVVTAMDSEDAILNGRDAGAFKAFSPLRFEAETGVAT